MGPYVLYIINDNTITFNCRRIKYRLKNSEIIEFLKLSCLK